MAIGRATKMDTYLSLLGIALSCASLVPVFAIKKHRLRAIGFAIAVLLFGVLATQLWQAVAEGRRTERIRDTVVKIFSDNNPMTAEQVLNEINRGRFFTSTSAVNYELVVKVLDALVADGTVQSRLVEVTAGNTKYIVRVFNSVNFSIP
jgi:ATP-dependent protease ClpP protease subunit